jgi:hypothetical protein
VITGAEPSTVQSWRVLMQGSVRDLVGRESKDRLGFEDEFLPRTFTSFEERWGLSLAMTTSSCLIAMQKVTRA